MTHHFRSAAPPAAVLALAAALVQPAPARADVWPFQTPSGNIQCSVGEEVDFADVRCTIYNREGPTAARDPGGCAGFGHHFILLERGPVEMPCRAVGSPSRGGESFPYGQTLRVGDIFCESSERGLRCANGDGRGFFLSRARQEVF